MSETIIPTVVMRRGDLVELHGVPELLPAALASFEWPPAVGKRLGAVGKVLDALHEAHAVWEEAHEAWEHDAPAADQKALEEAIRAGKPDPGTPATEAADRAEHVAWTRLQLALDDVRAANLKGVLADYLREQTKHLADHELERQKAHAAATRKAAALLAEAEDGANKPGAASAALKQYVAARWSDEDDHDTLLVARPDDSPARQRAIAERNAAILARWRRQAHGEPEPGQDITQAKATELAAAAEYGSTDAKAELTRRRAAPAPK